MKQAEARERRRIFALHYLADQSLNASAAAIKTGIPPNQSRQWANKALKDPEVKALIEAEMAARSDRTKIDADWLLLHLAEEATADIADLYDDDGNIKPVHEWPKVWRTGLVAGFEVEQLYEGRGRDRVEIGRLRKVKLADRTRIKELIGKHVNVQAFKEKLEHDVSESLASLIEKSMAPRE